MSSTCTELCTRLSGLQLRNGKLPSHDNLTRQLALGGEDSEDDQTAWPLGTLGELQKRTRCGFCQLVVRAISDSVEPSGSNLEQPVHVLVFPEEQSFRLSYPSRLGTRLAFVAEGEGQAGGPDSARLVRGSEIQVPLIRHWLDKCHEGHEECSLYTPEQPAAKHDRFKEGATSNFRVIDLQLGCITRAALDIGYVSLSYVWGQLPMFKLTKDNLHRLTREGCLEEIRLELPRTINDAIDLVLALGERYLWVDALCLVQDDEDDVSVGVELMNSVYQGSLFTIVAATGSDAGAGLPGLPRTPRIVSRATMAVTPDLKMTVLHSIDWHLARSVYNQRGWTLQELVLPRKTLIFTDNQVFFRCQEANWGEDSWSDLQLHWLDADDSNLIRVPDPNSGFLPCFWSYQKLCEEYSRRTLRNDGDALRAVAGILRPLAAGMETVLVEGLPAYYLDMFLLFISADGQMRRRKEFASFSWAGWDGSIMWPRENYYWYDSEGRRTWDTAHIVKWLRHKRLVVWGALDSSNFLDHLSTSPWDAPSKLGLLMQEHPHVFGLAADHDPDRQTYDINSTRGYISGSGSSGSIPDWDEPDDEAEKAKLGPLKGFSIEGFDLANSQVEFDRLVARLESPLGKLTLSNWLAMRRIRCRQALKGASARGPRSTKKQEEIHQYRFRAPRDDTFNVVLHGESTTDRRTQARREWADKLKQANRDDAVEGGELERLRQVPVFPPYPVLQFRAISFRLILGTFHKPRDQPSGENERDPAQSPFERIAGIPLMSGSGDNKLLGSLHPDNLDTLSEPGSAIECLVISRCQTPTVRSALLKPGTHNNKEHLEEAASTEERPWDLFWVLHVVWEKGIAERRGVGQVLAVALEETLGPGPVVKDVQLG